MGVEFLSPVFLAGTLAAAIPVVLHLLNRRRSKLVPVATLRFLRLIPARTFRRRRLEEYVLLAARAALLAFLALAAARPVLTEGEAGGGVTAAVVVLDDSWSMDYRVAGVTRFQEAAEGAVRILRSLRDGDRAALLLASDPAAETLTTDLDGLRRRAASARTSLRGPDLLAAAERGLALLEEAPEPNRELHLLTDLQDRAARPLVERLVPAPGNEGVRVVLTDVGPREPSNAGISEVSVGSGTAIAGEPVRVAARLTLSAPGPRSVRASLVIGEDRVAEQAATVSPGAPVSIAFRAAADLPGSTGGKVFLAGDDLGTDDERHFVLPVLGRIPVLLVNGDPSPLPHQDDAFYLTAALAPENLGASKVASPVDLNVILPDGLEEEDLRHYEVVVLANVATLPPRRIAALRAFVREGGGLMIFAGSRVRPGELGRDLGTDPLEGLLPALLSPAPEVGTATEDVTPFGRAELSHPLFADLPPSALEDLSRVNVRRALVADPGPAGGTVLARLSNERPLLIEKTVGRGRVLLFTTTADPEWGNLPLRPIFLPLMHRAVQILAGGDGSASGHVVGETVEIPSPRGEEAPEVTDPRGEVTRVTGPAGRLRYGPVERPGIYRVRGAGDGAEALFAVNVDPAEGRLERIDPEALRALFGAERFRLVEDVGDLEGTLARSREGRPVRVWLILAAAACFLFEGFLGNRIAAARAGVREAAA